MESMIKSYNDATHKLHYHNISRDLSVLKKALNNYDDKIESDMYGNGKIINDFESKMADLLGKESAVFFPSGTMAQQIAVRIWCDLKGVKTVAYHAKSHLEIHEQDGIKKLHNINTILLGEKDRLFTLSDLKTIKEKPGVVLLELPQREIGGQLPEFDEIVEISKYCKFNNIAIHLDGARLLECLPYYHKTAKEICRLFDSVYISFYKGLGGIAGAILAGNISLCEESKIWKRRHGGDLISLYPYVLSADYYYELRKERMESYYKTAVHLAIELNNIKHFRTIPKTPVTNMFHIHINLPMELVEQLLITIYNKTSVALKPGLIITNEGCMMELATGDALNEISEAKLKEFLKSLSTEFAKI